MIGVAQDVNQVMGLVGQRRQLVSELEELREQRLELMTSLKTASGRERGVMEQMAGQLDRQISGAENALRAIETLIATHTGSAPPPPPAQAVGEGFSYTTAPAALAVEGISMRDMWALSTGTLAIVALGLVAAFSYLRRIKRDTSNAVNQIRTELWDEMKKVSVGVDAIAVELERIGEGQRFVTKAIAERKEPAPREGQSR